MANERQLDMIRDLESAIRAITAEGIQPEETTIGLICDRAGLIVQNVRPTVLSLKRNEDFVSLARIKRVFLKAKQMPTWLEDVEIPDGEPEALKLDAFPTGKERRAQIAQSAPQNDVLDMEERIVQAATMVARTCMPFSKDARERVISAASVLCGVGG